MTNTPLAIGLSLVLAGASAPAATLPHPASPGSPERIARAGDRCPTFSWGAVPDAAAIQLAVYDATDDTAAPQVVVHLALPPSVSSWTPSLEHCLLAGRVYAWRVGAVDRDGEVTWSEPAWFDVAPPLAEAPAAWVDQVIERLSVVAAGERSSGGGTSPAGLVPTPARSPRPSAAAASYFAVGSGGAVTAGAVTATSFAGDGSALTSVNAATLQGQPGSYYRAWGNLTSVPAGFADNVDNDTTYTAGTGLTLQGTQFSLAAADNSRPGQTITTLDSGGDVGQHTSVTIGTDDLPLISYWDITNGDLKVAHCANVFCTPYFRRR